MLRNRLKGGDDDADADDEEEGVQCFYYYYEVFHFSKPSLTEIRLGLDR